MYFSCLFVDNLIMLSEKYEINYMNYSRIQTTNHASLKNTSK